MDVISQALGDGRRNYPPSEATDLSATEQRVVDYCQDRLAKIVQKASYSLHYLKLQLEKQLQDIKLPDFNIIVREIAAQAQHTRAQNQHNLTAIYKDAILHLGYLRHFVIKHHLNRPAEYPDSKMRAVYLLTFIAAIAASTNCYFFFQGKDLNMISGIFSFMILSLVNISWSFILGFIAYRSLNSIITVRKLAAISGVIIHNIVAFLINLAGAHYRELLARDPNNALTETVIRLSEQPFRLQTLGSILLFAIGMAIAVGTVWIAYTSDDSYPGYGRIDRRYKRILKRYQDHLGKLVNDTNSIIHGGSDRIKRQLRDLTSSADNAHKLYISCKMIEKTVSKSTNETNEAIKQLLRCYRQENSYIRDTSPPKYFYRYETINCSLDKELSSFYDATMQTLPKIISDAERLAEAALKQIIDENQEKLNAFIESLKERASSAIRREQRDIDLVELTLSGRNRPERYIILERMRRELRHLKGFYIACCGNLRKLLTQRARGWSSPIVVFAGVACLISALWLPAAHFVVTGNLLLTDHVVFLTGLGISFLQLRRYLGHRGDQR